MLTEDFEDQVLFLPRLLSDTGTHVFKRHPRVMRSEETTLHCQRVPAYGGYFFLFLQETKVPFAPIFVTELIPH